VDSPKAFCRHWQSKADCAFALNKIGSLNKINKAFSKLEQDFEREPTHEEISKVVD
jgi:DNA-directed RNA polymerase specialized sigma subunit